jgi:hypothetical protein
VGPDGNVAVTGYFVGTASFVGTNVVAPGAGVAMFVASYQPNGQLRWVRVGGGNGDVAGYGVSVDRSGICWVTGEFAGTANFDGLSLTAPGSLGQADMFVVRYNQSGNILSAYQGGGTNYDYGFALGTDAGSSAYVTGSYIGPANFGATTLTNASGTGDVFLTRVAPGIARPALFSTTSGGGNLTLSWGVGSADWTLVYYPALGVTPTVMNTPRTTNNGVVSVSLPTSGSSGFYQLRWP